MPINYSIFRIDWVEKPIYNSISTGLYKEPNLTPYVRYCVSMAVRNPTGVGPFSEEHCNRTKSASKSTIHFVLRILVSSNVPYQHSRVTVKCEQECS